MQITRQQLSRIGKRLSQLILLAGLLVVLFLGAAWYVLRFHQDFVISKLREKVHEKWRADLQLEGYRLHWARPFPMLQLRFAGLQLAAKDPPHHPLLTINEGTLELMPWTLLTRNFGDRSLLLDSVWVHIYKDSLQRNNLFFHKEGEQSATKELDISFGNFPDITANYLDFHHRDDYRRTWQWTKHRQLRIQPERHEPGDWSVHFLSDCFFEGLVFKDGEGGFLIDTEGKLDLHLSLAEEGRVIAWERSSLQVGRDTFFLHGRLRRGEPDRLQMYIASNGMQLADVLPLLSDKVKLALSDIRVDQPIRADFYLDNPLAPARKGAMRVDFATEAAAVSFKEVSMSAATVVGSYSNDCDKDGEGDPVTSCIDFSRLDGDVQGVLPTRLQGRITNLLDPWVTVDGRMDIDLPRLNSLLAANDKITFKTGEAQVNFQYGGRLAKVVTAPFGEEDISIEGDAVFADITIQTNNTALPSPVLSGCLYFDENHTRLEDVALDWRGANLQLSGNVSNLPEFLFYDDQVLLSDLSLDLDRLNLNHFISPAASKRKTKRRRPAQLMDWEALTRRVAQNVNGRIRLSVDSVRFDSLYLTELTTQLRLFSPLRPDYADSSMIRLDGLTAKFMGGAPLFAELRLSRDAVTEVVLDARLPSAIRPLSYFMPKDVKIVKGAAGMEITARAPLRNLTRPGRLAEGLRYEGRMKFDQLEVVSNNLKGPIRGLSGPLVFDERRLLFDQMKLQYGGSNFTVDGHIADYAFFKTRPAERARADLRVSGDHLDLRKPEKRADKTSDGQGFSPAELFRSLGQVFRHAGGEVELRLDSVLTDQRAITPVFARAQLLPDEDRPERHRLLIDSFAVGLVNNSKLTGNALVTNPDSPVLDANVRTRMKLVQLGQFLPSKYVDIEEGDFRLDLRYRSPLHDTLNAENYLLNATVDGEAEVKAGKVFYNYRDFTFDHIDGQFAFDQRTLYIKKLALEVNGNPMVATGQSSDFFSFFVLPDRPAKIELNVTSPLFDFSRFTAPKGLGKDTLIASTDERESTLRQTVGYIDRLLDEGSLEMGTDVEEVVYEDFTARNVSGSLLLRPDTVELQHLNMEVADGVFGIAGTISGTVRHQPRVEISAQLDENDVREIFRQFNNFGQTRLSADNIEGFTSADIRFQADVNANYEVLPTSIHGDLRITLAGGELIDVAALERLSGFLFRGRQLDHVLLDTLTMSMHLRGSDLYMDKFYLHSSSVDFAAQGRYSLGDNDKTRVLFAVPISNLFRRHVSPEEMRRGNSERKGIRILIEAKYKKDRIRFFWKPFVFNKKKYKLIEVEKR